MLVNDKITENEMFNKFDLNLLQQRRLVKTSNSSSSQNLKKESQTQSKGKFFANMTPTAKKNIEFNLE
jgi:hypothetical protein